MPVSKKTSELAEQIKKDMVNYIGPIFEELKTDIRQLDTKIDTKVAEVVDKINWQGTIMDEMRKDIRTALEASSFERDVKVLRAVENP
jgi:hypothetical protein